MLLSSIGKVVRAPRNSKEPTIATLKALFAKMENNWLSLTVPKMGTIFAHMKVGDHTIACDLD